MNVRLPPDLSQSASLGCSSKVLLRLKLGTSTALQDLSPFSLSSNTVSYALIIAEPTKTILQSITSYIDRIFNLIFFLTWKISAFRGETVPEPKLRLSLFTAILHENPLIPELKSFSEFLASESTTTSKELVAG